MFFDEVDKKRTRTNADRVLANYHSIRRIAGRTAEQKITSTFRFDGTSSSSGLPGRPIERIVERKLEAQSQLEDIQRAINSLSTISRRRLYLKYIAPTPQYDYEICMNECISESTYYRELGNALIEFAEAYRGGVLLETEK